MGFVMGTCSRIHVLDFGMIIAIGTPADVQANPSVRAAYLGGDADLETPETAADPDAEADAVTLATRRRRRGRRHRPRPSTTATRNRPRPRRCWSCAASTRATA